MDKIILASASPRRKELLALAGIPFICHPAEREERITQTTPEETVKELAAQKARETASYYNDAVILGADTVVCYNGKILGKPKDRRHAEEMITELQGKTHEVYTGVCILKKHQGIAEKELVFAEETQVEMYAMTPEEIHAYIDSGEGDDKAGAYGIQGKCAVFIRKITGDYYNVVGLPISRVYHSLKTIHYL